MKEAIGHVPLYNFLIIFIVITFGFLMATLTYFKAFKVNSRIAHVLEKFEGYNSESIKEINRALDAIGYRTGSVECPSSDNRHNLEYTDTSSVHHPICLYETRKEKGYFNYEITTFIYFDVPVIGGTFKIPVRTETEKIFEFNG